MKTRITIIALFLGIISALSANAQNKIFVIPVETEIDNSAFHHFKKGIRQAQEENARLVVLRLNTYGGALDAADSIRTALLRLNLPTVAFVDVNAASAGALIALACDSVFMAPAASMGSATVVNGAGEPLPEKYQSYMSTIMRATAEHHGRKSIGDSTAWRRDPAIAASMVNPAVSVSLTALQALECGYADGIASNIGEVLSDLDIDNYTISSYERSLSDNILGFLSNAAVRAILVMLILGGIYMEMHTPGLGFAAAVSVVATILYFLPMFAGGAIPAWVLLCFIAGIVLIAMEVFVIPGFGICGIGGIIAVAISLIGAMTSNDSVSGFDLASIGHSLCIVGTGCLLAIVAVLYLTSSRGPRFLRKHSELMKELTVDDGFVGVDMSLARYIGQSGCSVTDLRPAGKIEIEHEIFDAVSTGPFIAANKKVKVVKYENAQLYVAEIEVC
ncbi:MAG: nodulation protein NfeD [Muribaculaceae bacterium]|nr:nodulation protein NfeD [Muribaculaceae bacterium]